MSTGTKMKPSAIALKGQPDCATQALIGSHSRVRRLWWPPRILCAKALCVPSVSQGSLDLLIGKGQPAWLGKCPQPQPRRGQNSPAVDTAYREPCKLVDADDVQALTPAQPGRNVVDQAQRVVFVGPLGHGNGSPPSTCPGLGISLGRFGYLAEENIVADPHDYPFPRSCPAISAPRVHSHVMTMRLSLSWLRTLTTRLLAVLTCLTAPGPVAGWRGVATAVARS